MSRTPSYDAKIKVILDATQPGERVCSLLGDKWVLTQEEIDWCRRLNVPPSSYSQRTRWVLMAHYTTGYQFWWNKHFETGVPVLSFHHPTSGVRVLPDAEWFNKDFSDISLEVDPAQSLFPQLRELQKKIPMIATSTIVPAVNSISLVSMGDQNCYFTLACKAKNAYYSVLLIDGEECADMITVNKSNQCWNMLHCDRMYRCLVARESFDCVDSAFLFDCRDCEYCFGATNKRRRKYLWWNEQLSKEEWEKRRVSVDLSSRRVLEEQFAKFENLLQTETIWPENFNEKAIDSTGEYLTDCTNCRECFTLTEHSTDNYRCAYGHNTHGCFDCFGPFNATECYMSMTAANSTRLVGCWRTIGSDTCEYCITCYNCKNCFGCVGLQHKEFHIFNKPYSPGEYWRRVDELKCAMLERGEYGRFFLLSMATTYAPHGGSMLYCGASLEEMKKLGANMLEQCSDGACGVETAGAAMKSPDEIPDKLDEVTDEWTRTPIFDTKANRKFAFLPAELELYRKLRLAPPKEHFISRVIELFRTMQGCGFEKRVCVACSAEVTISFNAKYPDRKVYCKKCYLEYLEKNG
ncbi:hypothetical protein HYW18_03665 [Candidatus Uhrbacteria bacterium]|nr:hypothetical protein [Candidatus Uhrbacteria bacterium]